MPFVVYILQCADQTFYVGSTNNIEKRLHQHNYLKTGAKYTRGRRPVTLIYGEEYKTVGEARSREYVLKQLTREEKLVLLDLSL